MTDSTSSEGSGPASRSSQSKSLPSNPSLKHLRNEARALLKAHKQGDAACCNVLRGLKHFRDKPDQKVLDSDVSLVQVQFALSMAYGFESWERMKLAVSSSHRLDAIVTASQHGNYDEFLNLTGADGANFPQQRFEKIRAYLAKRCGTFLKSVFVYSDVKPDGRTRYIWKMIYEKGIWLQYMLVKESRGQHKLTEMQVIHGPIERLPLLENTASDLADSDEGKRISLRLAAPGDAALLAEIATRAFAWDKVAYGSMPPDSTTAEGQLSIMERPGAYYAICLDGRIVGAIGGLEWDEVSRTIGPIFIEPDLHRQGIGRRAIVLLREKHPRTPIWWVSTPHKSVHNQRFYEACGFVKEKEFTEDPLPPDVPDDFHLYLYGARTV